MAAVWGFVCLTHSRNPALRTFLKVPWQFSESTVLMLKMGTNMFLSRDSWREMLPGYLGCWLKPAPGASRTEDPVFSQASNREISKHLETTLLPSGPTKEAIGSTRLPSLCAMFPVSSALKGSCHHTGPIG